MSVGLGCGENIKLEMPRQFGMWGGVLLEIDSLGGVEYRK